VKDVENLCQTSLKRRHLWGGGVKWEDNIKMCVKEVKVWIGIILLWRSPVADSYEHGHESLGSIKGEEFFDRLSRSNGDCLRNSMHKARTAQCALL
jgi:hypothetical protein